jgi:hypothetical protein
VVRDDPADRLRGRARNRLGDLIAQATSRAASGAAAPTVPRRGATAPEAAWAGRNRSPGRRGRQLRELLDFLRAFDALGDDRRADLAGQRDEAGGERLQRAIAVEVIDQRAVELDELRLQPHDVAQAREPRPGVVDGDPDADARSSASDSRRLS